MIKDQVVTIDACKKVPDALIALPQIDLHSEITSSRSGAKER